MTAVILALTARQVVRAHRAQGDGAVTEVFRNRSPAAPGMTMFDGDLLDSAASHVVTHDPFRLERKPANVAFSITPPAIAGVPPQGPPVRIALQGMIGGPPWRAIVSGIPGHDGTIMVSSGDTLGGVTIRRIDRSGITVRVKDSTWTVTLAKAGA
jgi:hypothetical protein